MHPHQAWLDLAFDSVDAQRASEAIDFHRQERLAQGVLTRSYEVVVPSPPPPLAAYLQGLGARLRDHLGSLGLSPHGTSGVFLSVFSGPRLYFIGSVETLSLVGRLTPPLALPGRVH